MIKAFEIRRDLNLDAYRKLLWQQRISHVIKPYGDMNLVAVAKPEDVEKARLLFSQWQRGEITPDDAASSSVGGYVNGNDLVGGFLQAFTRTPLTLSIVSACIVIAVLTLSLGYDGLFRALLYPDFSYGTSYINLDRVLAGFNFAQLAKMLGPIFLHGGYVHLAFNMLWFWEFGKRIERVQASWIFALLIIFVALISNTYQYLMGGGNNFVGISGVVYGLLAYIGMWQVIDPRKGLNIQTSLLVIMIVILVVLTWMDLAILANEAHLAGLVSGGVAGAILAATSRLRRTHD